MEGGSNVDGDESGGTSPSRQGAGARILVPRILMAMAAEIGIASGEKGSEIRVSATRCKYMPKGGIRGGLGWQAAWSPCGSPRLYFGRTVAPGTLIFYIYFLDFSWQFS